MIRHGQSAGNLTGVISGWNDYPLTETGITQAKSAGSVIGEIAFDKVYCSDLTRAKQTCRFALPGCEPECTADLRETTAGSGDGRRWDEVRSENPEAFAHALKYQDFSYLGGETEAEFDGRIARFMKKAEALENVENIAVFGHEGTVHRVIRYVLQQDVLLENLRIRNASVTVFEYVNGVWKLCGLNIVGEDYPRP